MARVRFKEKDFGWKQIKKNLLEISRYEAAVGVLKSDGDKRYSETQNKKSVTVLQVASAHEFGAPSINLPKRSFIRQAVDKNRRGIERMKTQQYKRIIFGTASVQTALATVAEYVRGKILLQFRREGDPKWKDLSERYKRYRLSKNPKRKSGSQKRVSKIKILQDTGTLRQSINYQVRRRSIFK